MPGTSNSYYTDQNQSAPSGAYGGGIRMMAFDAATGESIWNQSRAGNTQPTYVPCYVDGAIFAPEFFEITKMDAEEPLTTGTVDPVPDFSYSNRVNGVREWAAWLGYQIQGSVAYADDLTGAKIYAGSDIGSVYCLNATDGSTYSVFTAGGNIAGSPTVWNGRMYVGTTEGILYCIDSTPTVDFNLYAASNKGTDMWNNETLSIGGRLVSLPKMMQWDYDCRAYVPVDSEYTPGLSEATVVISFNKPDGSAQNVTATTDKDGYFTINYNPTAVGTWGWVAYYEGMRTPGLTYNQAYSEYNLVSVTSPSAQPAPTSTPSASPQPTVAPTATPEPTVAPTATPEPTVAPTATPEPTVAPTATPAPTAEPTTAEGGLAVEYIYAAIAVIIIVVVVVAVYVYTKRGIQ
jgi:outer membrane protein assembly factor BamB